MRIKITVFEPSALLLMRSFLVGKGSRDAKGQRYLLGAILGVAFSLIPLILVLVVSDSMIQGITSRYIETGTYHIQASTPAGESGSAEEEMIKAAAAIISLPHITSVTRETQGPAIVVSGDKSTGALVRAVEESYFQDPGILSYLEITGGNPGNLKSRDAIIGSALASSLSLKPGDSFGLMTASAYSSAGGTPELVPKISFFRVRAVANAGYRELDSLWIFVNPDAGKKLLSSESSRSFIGIKVADPYDKRLYADARMIKAVLTNSTTELSTGWYVRPWQDIEQSLFRSFATTKSLLILVMAIAVAVAAVNVASALSMLAIERKQDIAVIKATGADGRFVIKIFVLAGATTGLIGTFLGVFAGVILSWRINEIIRGLELVLNSFVSVFAMLDGSRTNAAGRTLKLLDPQYYLTRIPVYIDLKEILLVAVFSITLCSIVSFIPARKASRLSPLEIARKV